MFKKLLSKFWRVRVEPVEKPKQSRRPSPKIQERKSRAIIMFKAGATPQEISKELGVKLRTAYAYTQGVRNERRPQTSS